MEIIKKIKQKISKEIKAGVWYTFGNFFLKGISIITIPIFTRLLTTTDYGQIALYTTWISVFSCIVGLSLNSSVVLGKYDYESTYNQYLSSVLFLSSLSFFCILFIVVIFRESISNIIGFPISIIILMVFQSYFSFVISFNASKYICEYKYKTSLAISLTSTIINVILSVILVLLIHENKYLGRIFGGAITTSIFGFIIFIFIIFKGKELINKEYWKYALVLSLPMMPHLLSQLILGQSDKIMIDKFIGSSAVGIYSFSYNIGTIVLIFLGSLNNAWVPWFYKKMDLKEYYEIINKTKYYMMLFISLVILLIFTSPELVYFMGPARYRVGIIFIPIIIVSYYFQFLYTLLVNIEFFYKKNFFIPIGTLIAAILNILLNFYFIPRYGYIAAAYTTLVSYIVLFIMHYLVATYLLEINIYKFKFFIKPTLHVIAFTILFYFIRNVVIIRYAVLLSVVIIILTKYRGKVLEFLR